MITLMTIFKTLCVSESILLALILRNRTDQREGKKKKGKRKK